MKRGVLILAICFCMLALCAAVYAENSEAEAGKMVRKVGNLRKNCGCGFGTEIWEGSDTLIAQWCAIGSNHMLSFNQQYGISTGTSGCEQFSSIAYNSPVEIFVADNMDNLAKDIAKGDGEYLTTLAILFQISKDNRDGFYTKMHSNFSRIYTSDEVISTDVVKNIDKIMKES